MDIKVEHSKLFELLIIQAKNGINNLIRTYNQTDKTHVLHTLQMYKNMLDGTTYNYHHTPATNATLVNVSSLIQLPLLSLSSTNSLNHINSSSSSITSTIQNNNTQNANTSVVDKNNKNYKNNAFDKRNKTNSKHENDKNDNASLPLFTTTTTTSDEKNESEKDFNKDWTHSSSSSLSTSTTNLVSSVPSTRSQTSPRRATPTLSTSCQPEIDMDTIFIKISELYSDEIFRIIYNAFIEMSRDETNYLDYASGLNFILHPINIRIKKWIDENIVF